MSNSRPKYFSILPKAIEIDLSSSDDDIPDIEPIQPVRRVAFPQRINHSISQRRDETKSDQNQPLNAICQSKNLQSQNFPKKKISNIPKTTNEALQQDAAKLLVDEVAEKNANLKKQKESLMIKIQSLQRSNAKKIEEHRNRLETLAFQTEKLTITLKNEKKARQLELQEKLQQRDLNERYIKINQLQEHYDKTVNSFQLCSDTINQLAKILSYSVISENELDILESTSPLNSPIGHCISDFFDAAKEILIQSQKQ